MSAISLFIGGSAGGTFSTASVTRYTGLLSGNAGAIGTAPATTESHVQQKVGTAGSLSNFAITCPTNARTTNTTFQTRVNGGNGTQLVTATASTTGTFSDTSHTQALAVNDLVNLTFATGSGTGNIVCSLSSVSFTATSSTSIAIGQTNDTGVAMSGTGPITDFVSLAGNNTASTVTEAAAQLLAQIGGTAKYLQIFVITNGRSTTTTATFRKNGGNGNQTFTVSSSSTGLFNDTTHTDSLSTNDLVCLQIALGTGTGTFTLSMEAVWIDSGTDGLSWHGNALVSGASHGAGTTTNSPIAGTVQTGIAEGTCQGQISDAVAFKGLWVNVSTNASTTNATTTFRVAAANGSEVATITALTTGGFQDTTHTDSIFTGQKINYRTTNITTGAIVITEFGIEISTPSSQSGAGNADGSASVSGAPATLGASDGSSSSAGNAAAAGTVTGVASSSGGGATSGNSGAGASLTGASASRYSADGAASVSSTPGSVGASDGSASSAGATATHGNADGSADVEGIGQEINPPAATGDRLVRIIGAPKLKSQVN